MDTCKCIDSNIELKCTSYNFIQTLGILPGIWCVLDSKFNFIYYNQAYAKFCGIDEKNLDFFIGKPRSEIPAYKSASGSKYFLRSDEIVLKQKKIVQTLSCMPASDHGWMLWKVIKSPILNHEGEIEAMIFQYIDQSANHYLDIALHYAKKYESLNSFQDDSELLIYSKNQHINLKPPHSECLFYLTRGLSYKEIARKQGVSYRTVVDQVERLKVKLQASTTEDLVSKSLTSGCVNHIPRSFIDEPMFITLSDHMAINQDLHANVALNNKNFKQTFDLLPGVWAVLDNQSRFIYYNQQYELMVGIDKMPKDFLIGKTAKSLPGNMNKCVHYFWQTDNAVIKTKKMVSILYCLLGPNNMWVVFVLNKSPILNSDNEVEAIICQYLLQTENNAIDLVSSLSKENYISEYIYENGNRVFDLIKNPSQISLKNNEFECLFYLTRGYSHKEIARRQKVSYRTISYYIKNLKEKFNVKTVTQLVSKSLVSGYINSVPKNLFSKQMAIIMQD